eukprot:CAMPEP_0113711216 /NCGR_PEP_ID=MMETSP0038_2-20120614/30624_1 /TAXON_ID=2898 /ORGANISM="Cryptomonas paramecium" /LENGTH=121 /DNA_ID=CAMNT_0000637429 /DNA_START=19 /DNA_END=380 /DNA_ORIENTATION=+ /assembly_acc=CAM_ASM_000170
MEEDGEASLIDRAQKVIGRVDDVYKHESFDSLKQVFEVLSQQPDSAVARQDLQTQLDAVDDIFEEMIHEYHGAILDNSKRHGEVLELYQGLSSKVEQLSSDIDEAKRLLRFKGAESLLQLR